MSAEPTLILASGSPRRRALLASLGIAFEVEVPRVEELRRPGEAPAAFARRLAAEKAAEVATRRGETRPILAADTTVVLGDDVLGKPESPEDAVRMLRALSGRSHQVVTGLAVAADGIVHQQAVSTEVRFRPLTEREIAWYVATGEAADAAGAYKIQEIGGALVASIDGSHSNVVGLPLAETLALLGAVGLVLPWDAETTR